MNRLFAPAFTLTAIMAVGCSLLPAKTFNEQYGLGVTAADGALKTIDTLLVAGKITPASAQNDQDQVHNAKAALDLAKQTYATDQASGGNKLAEALTVINGITRYLAEQQGSAK